MSLRRPLGQTLAVRSLTAGLVGLAVVWLTGFVIGDLGNPVALALAFVAAVLGTVLMQAGFPFVVRRHPYLAAVAAAIVGTALVVGVVFVIAPQPIGPLR
jgi:hypothetical protein